MALITSVSLVVIGSSIVIDKKHKSLQTHQNDVASIADTTSTTAVLGQQYMSDSSAYLVTAKEFNFANYVEYKITVKNISDGRLEFSPGLQFKLVDIKKSTLGNVIQPKDTILMTGGPIEVGQESKGNIFFETPKESRELRFYPDPSLTDYILVNVE